MAVRSSKQHLLLSTRRFAAYRTTYSAPRPPCTVSVVLNHPVAPDSAKAESAEGWLWDAARADLQLRAPHIQHPVRPAQSPRCWTILECQVLRERD